MGAPMLFSFDYAKNAYGTYVKINTTKNVMIAVSEFAQELLSCHTKNISQKGTMALMRQSNLQAPYLWFCCLLPTTIVSEK